MGADRMRIKVVPEAEPNADGSWVEVPYRDQPTYGRFTFRQMADLYADAVPEGYFPVQFDRVPSGETTGRATGPTIGNHDHAGLPHLPGRPAWKTWRD